MEKDNHMQVTDRVGDLTKHKRMLGKLDYNTRDQNINTKLTLHRKQEQEIRTLNNKTCQV